MYFALNTYNLMYKKHFPHEVERYHKTVFHKLLHKSHMPGWLEC